MIELVTPNKEVSRKQGYVAILFLCLTLGVGWSLLKPVVFPNPFEVIAAIPGLWQDGLGSELVSSFSVNVEALILSSLIGLPIAYLSRVPILTPACEFVAKLRFVGAAVFFLPLLFLLPSGHQIKVALLTLGELFYLVTTMNGVVQGLPLFLYDDVRTLRMSEWKSIWYVNIRGTVAQAITAIRDNAAMGWSMLMFVEGIVRGEGGVGVMLLNQEKHVNFANVAAIILVILLTGIVQDYFLTSVKKVVCPYEA